MSSPTSRWLTAERWWSCTYSIGSSMVRMCTARFALIQSTIDARVVDLPDPVGPVTNTSPWVRLAELADRPRQADVVERRDVPRDDPQRDGDGALLPERVAADPGGVAPGEGEVDLGTGGELRALTLVEEAEREALGVRGGEGGDALGGVQAAVDAQQGRGAGGEEEVGAPGLPQPAEQGVDVEVERKGGHVVTLSWSVGAGLGPVSGMQQRPGSGAAGPLRLRISRCRCDRRRHAL